MRALVENERMGLDLSRRGFFSGLGALFIAAPAIVRASSIMPVKALKSVIYSNRIIRCYADIKAIRDTNIFLRFDDYGGTPGAFFRDVPIAVSDHVITTEVGGVSG